MPNNLQQASRRSQYESLVNQLDNFGTDPNNFEMVDPTNLLEAVVGGFVERVHANINAADNLTVTGKIADIEIKVVNDEVQVHAPSHLIYQSRGVNGAKKKLYNTPHKYDQLRPPVGPIKEWIKEKRIRLINNETYYGEAPFKEMTEDEKINAAAYAIREKIYQEGFKGHDLYEKEIPGLVDDLSETIADFAVQQITHHIDLINPETNRIILTKK